MDTLPLPPRPNLAQYRKRAKDLVSAANAPDDAAVRTWATEWLDALVRLLGVTITPFVRGSFDRAVGAIVERVGDKVRSSRTTDAGFTLADAQYLIASAHGFENWAAFVAHVEGRPKTGEPGQEFEMAADAVVDGDLTTLGALLRDHPELIRARSARVHRATLLHYVAANGVEDWRQRTPANAVDVAKLLLESGAEVDALANTYGGGSAQTTMNLLVSSAHPAGAGLQPALAETLLDYGAAIDGLDDDGSPIMTAMAFGYGKVAGTLARRGAKLDTIVSAAALGRLDLVQRFLIDGHTLAPDVPFVTTRWPSVPRDARANIELGFVWASSMGRLSVVEHMLAKGVNPAAKDTDAMTALHWAAGNGWLEIVELLLRAGAPLEVRNTWGGTVLDSTVYFARQHPADDVSYLPVIQALIAAGADVSAVTPFPTGNAHVDELLRNAGHT